VPLYNYYTAPDRKGTQEKRQRTERSVVVRCSLFGVRTTADLVNKEWQKNDDNPTNLYFRAHYIGQLRTPVGPEVLFMGVLSFARHFLGHLR